MNEQHFLKAIASSQPSAGERAVALIWFLTEHLRSDSPSLSEVCEKIQSAGYGLQNRTRTKKTLLKDRRVTGSTNGYGIHASSVTALSDAYSPLLGPPKVTLKDGFLPAELFDKSRQYTKRVTAQLNASYEHGLYDCSAVMCRRILETLIIEAYEHGKFEKSLKSGDGNYLMLSGMIDQISKKNELNIGRNTLRGLKDLKKLGDLSAHNRRYNARKPDLDRVQQSMRETGGRNEFCVLSHDSLRREQWHDARRLNLDFPMS